MTTTTSTKQIGTEPEFAFLDPNEVIVEANVRTEDKTFVSKEFVASIRAEGILTPVTCRRDEDGKVYVRAGQRRTLAAREAGVRLPAVIYAASTATVDRLAQQIIENDQREALTEGDRMAAWEQMAFEGLAPEKIAKKTFTTAERVKNGIAVSKSDVAKATVESHGITLDQAAVLIEFEDDAELHDQLTQAATDDPAQFEHEVQRARDYRAERREVEAQQTEWALKGYTIITSRPYYGDAEWETVSQLRKDGTTVDDAAARAESIGEDRGVHIGRKFEDGEYKVAPTFYVRNITTHGFDPRPTTSKAQAGPMTDEQKAERKRLIANNKAWESAETVRREWIASKLLTRKAIPKDATAFIAAALTGHRAHLADRMMQGNGVAAELLGLTVSGMDPIGAYLTKHPARAPFVTLAIVVGGIEGSTGRDTWRHERNREAFAGYFTQLQTWGYTLSPVERIVIDGLPDLAAEDDETTETSAEDAAEAV